MYAPAVTGCRTKQAGESAPSAATVTSLELPSLKDVEEVFGEISQEVLQQPGTVIERTMPILREAQDEQVITDKPKRTINKAVNIFFSD